MSSVVELRWWECQIDSCQPIVDRYGWSREDSQTPFFNEKIFLNEMKCVGIGCRFCCCCCWRSKCVRKNRREANFFICNCGCWINHYLFVIIKFSLLLLWVIEIILVVFRVGWCWVGGGEGVGGFFVGHSWILVELAVSKGVGVVWRAGRGSQRDSELFLFFFVFSFCNRLFDFFFSLFF